MANLKLVIRKGQTKENGECAVYAQITHRGSAEWISTGIYVLPQNFKATRVYGGKGGDPNAGMKNIQLNEIVTKYERKLLNLGEKANSLDTKVIKKFLLSRSEVFCVTDFFEYTKRRIKDLEEMGRSGTVVPLTNTLHRMQEYHPKPLDFSEITVSFLEKFIADQHKQGKKKNTIALYLRYIRSMFNSAIDEYNSNPADPVVTNYPFRRLKIESEPTKNRNLSMEIIRKIRDAKLPTSKMEIARDIFMLQIYLMGINTKDLFYMRKENIKNGRLQFNRHKTDRFYNMKIEPEAAVILEKYEGQKYLLWFADYCLDERDLNYTPHTRRSEFQYANSEAFNKMLNQQLRKIAELLDIETDGNFTTYFSRHSFATIMREIGISKDDISICLGHREPEHNLITTGIYINEDYRKTDIANRLFIDELNKKEEINENKIVI